MARSFILLSLLKESHGVDIMTTHRQSLNLRHTDIMIRGDECVRLFRLNEELLTKVLDEIKTFIITRPTQRSLHIRTKLLCTLSFLASGSYQRLLGRNLYNFISQPSTSRCINEIVNVLCHPSIIKKYITFPQCALERQKLKERFYEKFGMPGVIGCIDGTFVAMVRPKMNEERYFCRKGYHARNIALITDADLNILHVDASYGGASHDSFIFNNSAIKSHLEELTNNGETVYLLGDSGYAQRQYMMTPIANPREGPEAHYNKIHGTARNSIERAIGILKGRFRCLLVQRSLQYNPEMVAKIVIACCVLHNICNRAGLSSPSLGRTELQAETNILTHQDMVASDLGAGRAARQVLVNTLWHARV